MPNSAGDVGSLRPPTLVLSKGERVAVTAADGFIGSAVVRALVARGIHVVAVMDPVAPYKSSVDPSAEKVTTDILDTGALSRIFSDIRVVVHISPDYRLVSRDPALFQSINVEGTRSVLLAARAAGCEKVIYTSSVGTLALEGATIEHPADESNAARFDQLDGFYRKSKYSAEHEVMRIAAQGLPVTTVLPTTPLGPFDFAPTPSGRIVVDFLNGSFSSWFDSALNVVDVDDLADGYVLAIERGGIGRSYILGGRNIEFRQIFSYLAESTGLSRKAVRVPRPVAMTAGVLSELVEGRILRREPTIPIEGVRLATRRLVFSDQRARGELGYRSRDILETMERTARWFAENGYVASNGLSKIKWRSEEGHNGESVEP